MRLLLISAIVLFSACQTTQEKPEYLWEKEKFIAVLTEFQLAESVVRLGYHRGQDSVYLNDSIYASMFRKMQVNKVDFDSNFNYYMHDPESMEEIYKEVIEQLSERSAKLSKIE